MVSLPNLLRAVIIKMYSISLNDCSGIWKWTCGFWSSFCWWDVVNSLTSMYRWATSTAQQIYNFNITGYILMCLWIHCRSLLLRIFSFGWFTCSFHFPLFVLSCSWYENSVAHRVCLALPFFTTVWKSCGIRVSSLNVLKNSPLQTQISMFHSCKLLIT
jgi:hypothetical protein